ncbi:MAG: hypothetical protein HUJ94_08015 [Bacteroidales bacterium]|nr:hypothetical protein [Bacteroidales bacterium]
MKTRSCFCLFQPGAAWAALAALLLVAGVTSCGTQAKLRKMQKDGPKARLELADDRSILDEMIKNPAVARDTLKIKDAEGREFLVMKAIRDTESGEMVAHETIDAAVVTARFRNVPEKQGKVDLQFQVLVPASMQDSKWQLRFYPDMYILDDVVGLEPVMITGNGYRKAQLKGYQQYNKFVSKIVNDTTRFIDLRNLEIFLKRNIPQVYAFKSDSSYVSDEQFFSMFGVSEQEAVDHYTNMRAKRMNERRRSKVDRMYAKYVKSPIVTEGIRLDTVIVTRAGDFIYNYTQTINTRPRLRKVDIVLSGDIYEQDELIYTIPESQPLTFYISSVSAFADNTERYLTKVIERRAEANAEYNVEFAQNRSDIDLKLGNNASEIAKIKQNLSELIRNRTFDLDSIVVVSSASPEGKVSVNQKISAQRGTSISRYFNDYIRHYQDSLVNNGALEVDENGKLSRMKVSNVDIRSRSNGENWRMLDYLVISDPNLTEGQKSRYSELSTVSDPDRREGLMKAEKSYAYISGKLYPRLRSTGFNFYLHRKGMVKDTIQTTVIDSVYMAGVQALRDMDYNLAISCLQPYADFNTAVTYIALNRDANALLILEDMEKTAKVNYLLAIVYQRRGDYQKAVECYLNACDKDSSYIHRGKLDPEISALIRLYGLHQQQD